MSSGSHLDDEKNVNTNSLYPSRIVAHALSQIFMKLSERVRLDPKRRKSNGNPYFLLPVSMVTGFKIFDQKLNKFKIIENGLFLHNCIF